MKPHLERDRRHLGMNQNNVSAEAKHRLRSKFESMVFMFCIESIYTQGKKDLEFKLEPSVLNTNFVRLRGSAGKER